MAKKWKRSYIYRSGKKMKIFIYNPNEEGCSAQLIRTNGSDLSRSNFIPFAIISPPTVIILPLSFSCQCHFNNIGSSSRSSISSYIVDQTCPKWLHWKFYSFHHLSQMTVKRMFSEDIWQFNISHWFPRILVVGHVRDPRMTCKLKAGGGGGGVKFWQGH